ncbi:sulfurtransferase [Candidatus Cyanaurora vandensis]|uniref:sulfurtransferase n=1 Tax=Candidatus Cyanaurora vandensis TaxID=2714958 RepID=UPI00257EEE96|nr:sulfurtransferase [Candidatus Cyanaurora vandensis]
MILTCAELAQQLDNPRLRVVDIRGNVGHRDLGDGFEQGVYTADRAGYEAGHIPGAVFVDWTMDIVDLTQTVPAQVASAEQFARLVGELGIDNETTVVIYDQGVAQFATRLWWCFQYYGHPDCRVLAGGWQAWQKGGYPVSTATLDYPARTFTPRVQPQWRIEPPELLALLENPQIKVIDARPPAHYRGERSRATHKGHIPGAVNLPRPDLMTTDGFKSLDEWAAQFKQLGIEPTDTVVAYCNGGVAASTVLFALHSLGYPNLRLYDGSWNEWGRLDLPRSTPPAD